MMLRAALAVLLPLSGAAHAQGLSGTWAAKDVSITLTQSGDQISGNLVTDRKNISFAGVVEGNQAFGEVTGPNGSVPFTLTLVGKAVKFEMTGPDGKALTFFLKRGKPGAASTAAAAPAAPPAPDSPGAEPALGPPPPAAAGLWKNDNEGWSVRSPPGWKGGEQKDGAVVLGHDTEWGVLRVYHQIGARLEEVRAQGENGYTLDGVTFAPTAAIAPLRVKAGQAIVGDYQGQSQQGPMRVHTAALQGPLGVLLISGGGLASNYGKLAQRVEAMAASAAFFKGKAGNAVQHVAGTWWHWRGSSSTGYGSNSTSSSYSVEKKLWLCADGRFSRTGNSSVDVSARSEARTTSASRYGDSGSDGRWTAIGTAQAGRIIVTLSNGSREELGYQRAAQGDKWQIYIDGTGYLFDEKMGGCQ